MRRSDFAYGKVKPIPVERAQEMLRRMKTKEHASSGATVDLELRLEFAEQQLMSQFNEFTKTFSSRNVILVYKAK